MPPYEAPLAVQAPRYTESEASTGNCSEVLGLVVTVIALSVLCVLTLLTATIQWRRFLTARESQQEIADSLNGMLQNFSRLREKNEAQSKEVFRLQKVVKRFMPSAQTQSSWVTQATTERNATGTARVPGATKHEREDNLTPRAPLPLHEEVFVVGCDEEEEEEAAEQNTEHDARACDSRPDSSTFEDDPSAPRIATTGVVHTGARLPSEEPASARS